jgi:hypothetical protein
MYAHLQFFGFFGSSSESQVTRLGSLADREDFSLSSTACLSTSCLYGMPPLISSYVVSSRTSPSSFTSSFSYLNSLHLVVESRGYVAGPHLHRYADLRLRGSKPSDRLETGLILCGPRLGRQIFVALIHFGTIFETGDVKHSPCRCLDRKITGEGIHYKFGRMNRDEPVHLPLTVFRRQSAEVESFAKGLLWRQ